MAPQARHDPGYLVHLLGGIYVLAVKAPVYQASASFALVYPPAAPTEAQLAANPKLAQVSTFNPLVGYGDPTAVIQIVISVLGTPSSQQTLLKAGAGTQYQIASSVGSPYIVDVTGVGDTAQAAVLSANVVTQATKHALYQVQVNQGVNPRYMITTYPLSSPNQAGQKLSTKLRPLIAVLGLGVLLLFIAISIAEAMARQRIKPSTDNIMEPSNDNIIATPIAPLVEDTQSFQSLMGPKSPSR